MPSSQTHRVVALRACRAALCLLAALGLLAAVGCGAPRPTPAPPAAALQSATLQQLVNSFNRNANSIHTMVLKLKLTARVGQKKYPGVNAFLLTQDPSSVRIWGSFTLIGRLFDMASDGTHFELSLPTKNQFIEGMNDVIPAITPNPLEKLRPQVIRNALLVNPIGAGQHVAFDPDESATEYDVLVLDPGAKGVVDHLVRRITFSRYDLLPHRQVIYDGDEVHATRATYGKFTLRNNIPIPLDMTIERPVEGYSLRLQVESDGITLNQPFTVPNTFELKQPPGSTLIKISSLAPAPAVAGQSAGGAIHPPQP